MLHAMLGVDAQTGGALGLVAGRIWTRRGRIEAPHAERRLADKQSERWLSTADAAKGVLRQAAMVTEVSDREGDSSPPMRSYFQSLAHGWTLRDV